MPKQRPRTHVWCSGCQRVYSAAAWWHHNWTCPADCGAGSRQLRQWEDLRQTHPDLPPVPREGERYPLGQPAGVT